MRNQGRLVAQMLGIGLVAAAVLTAITLVMDWFPVQASTAADDIDWLYDLLLIASVPIFVLVMTVAIFCVVKFRARPDEEGDGAPIKGNSKLEAVWVAIPFLIVAGLAVYGWFVLDDIEAKQPNPMHVKVTGRQFSWSFEYPRPGAAPIKSDELNLPKDQPVEFEIVSQDVIHSFWVPAFRLKQDAVPGITATTLLTPNRLGTYPIVCAELCGIGHATMRQVANVMPANQFAAWLASKSPPPPGAPRDPLASGRQLFASQGCAGCHTLADAGAQAATGPSLDGLAEIAEKRNPRLSLREYVRESIVNPDVFLVRGYPSGVMPANYADQLTTREIETLVDYLVKASEDRGRSQARGGAAGAGGGMPPAGGATPPAAGIPPAGGGTPR